MDNTKLFLDYIRSYGFNPNNYKTIWELASSPQESISRYLSDYNQYLISRKVKRVDLEDYDILGSYGYLNENGIVVETRYTHEDRMLYSKDKICHNHSYEYPQLKKEDVFIANGYERYISNLVIYDQDKYVGFCMDNNNPELKIAFKTYKKLLVDLNSIGSNKYTIELDTLSHEDKTLLVLKKKYK